MNYIYHGTNAKLLDKGLVAGTFFTKDLEIALKYGNTIYVIDETLYKGTFTVNWEGHYVSHGFIPLEYFITLRSDEEYGIY